MQITLDQEEIHDALTDYVRQRISIKDNQNIEIDLKNGRGENKTTAIINITSSNSKVIQSVSPDEDEDILQDIEFDEYDKEYEEEAPRPALFGS